MTGQASKTASTRQGLKAFIEIEQSALDAIPTGLCVCRADGTLARYNRRAVTLWGRAPRLDDPSEISAGNFRRYTPQGMALAFAATPVATTLRTGQPVVGAEIIIERPDNTQVPVLMNVAPLDDGQGRVVGAICSFQELTERKRAEEALRSSEERFSTIFQSSPVAMFLTRAAHEYRIYDINDA